MSGGASRGLDFDRMADRELALTSACPRPPRGCGAAAGEQCRNLITGEPLARLGAHDARIRAAAAREDG